MKLSELDPKSFKVVSASDKPPEAAAEPASLRLSDLDPSELKVIEPPSSAAKPEETLMDKLKDPERWQAIFFGTGPKAPNVVAGTPSLAVPVGPAAIAGGFQAPAIVDKVAKVMQASRTARVAANTAQGAVSDNENRLRGAAIGLASGLGGEALNKAFSGAKGVSSRAARFNNAQADAYVENPKAVEEMADMLGNHSKEHKLQDKAVQVLSEGRAKLKAKGLAAAEKLRGILNGKTLDIDVAGMEGMSPEIDQIIGKARAARTSDAVSAFKEVGNPNTVFKFDANEANRLKRALQELADYKPKPGTVLDPAVEARSATAGAYARRVMGGLESLDPSVSGLNKEMMQGMQHQKVLREGGKKNPLAFLGTESPDAGAALSRAEEAGASGLSKFRSQYGAAKSVNPKDVDDALTRQATRFAGRVGLKATAALSGSGSAVAPFAGRTFSKSDNANPAPVPSETEPNPAVVEEPQPRGFDKWALKGAENLGITDADLRDRILQSRVGRRLLIEASDLSPGSKRLQAILNQLQGWEKTNGNKPQSVSKVPGVGLERKPTGGR